MKKFFYFVVLVVGFSITETSAQTKFFAFGGLNLGNLKSTESIDGDVSPLPGFDIGLGISIPIAPKYFRIQVSPSVRSQATKFESDMGEFTSTYYRENLSLFRAVVPVDFVFELPLGEKASISVGAGVFAGYNLAGKIKVSARLTDDLSFTESYPIEWDQQGLWYYKPVGTYADGFTEYYVYNMYTYKNLDAGLDFRFAARFEDKLLITVARQNSITPFMEYPGYPHKLFLRSTQVTVGYMF